MPITPEHAVFRNIERKKEKELQKEKNSWNKILEFFSKLDNFIIDNCEDNPVIYQLIVKDYAEIIGGIDGLLKVVKERYTEVGWKVKILKENDSEQISLKAK